MNYFEVWNEILSLGYDDSEFCQHFLSRAAYIEEIFQNGSKEMQHQAFTVIKEIPFERLVLNIEHDQHSFQPGDVPCFSSLNNGLERVPELLQFHESGISYQELGYLLKKGTTATACIKYGENHAKLAELASLVNIKKTKPATIRCSAFGKYLIHYPMDEKEQVLKKMLLRDPYIQHLISQAICGEASYKESVKALKTTTAVRRRTSTKELVHFVLRNTEYQEDYHNIDWSL